MNKRLLLRLLAASLCLLLLGGCMTTGIDPFDDLLRLVRPRGDAPEADFSDPPVRADLDYADMVYEHYDLARYAALTDALTDAAATGTQEAFDGACAAAESGLLEIATLNALADVRASADAADEGLAEEYLYIRGVYRDAYDLLWTALHDVAAGGRADLLESRYSRQQRGWFESYVSADEESDALHDRESALEKQYERLMAQTPLDGDAVCALFAELVALRQEIAADEGYDSYAAYAYEVLYARTYTPEDAQRLWRAAKRNIDPLLADCSEEIGREAEALDARALDCAPARVIDAVCAAAETVGPEAAEAAACLRDRGLYDLSSDPGRVQVGYTTYLYAYGVPFIFDTTGDRYYDYLDLFHEFGHFLSYYWNGSDLLFGMPDNDLSELQSQGMEVLAMRRYDALFGDLADTARRSTLLDLLYSVSDGAMYDEFQQKVYAEDAPDAERIRDIFSEVWESWGYAPYDGMQEEWMTQLHNFEYPFYYISYAVSAVPALELYTIALDDPEDAAARYRALVTMDPEEWYFVDAVEAAGLSDVFSASTLRALASDLRAVLTAR